MEVSGKLWICLLLLAFLAVPKCDARARRNPVCNEEQQNRMTKEFGECLTKYTKEHHESSGKATTSADYQVLLL